MFCLQGVPDVPREPPDDLTSLAPHERLPEILVVPREKTPTGPCPEKQKLSRV